MLILCEGDLCKLSVVSFSQLGVASFQTEASGGLALPVADAFEYKGVFKAQRKELSLQLIMLYLLHGYSALGFLY